MIRQLLQTCGNWNKIAVIEEAGAYTYRDIYIKAVAVANRLGGLSCDKVAILLPNGADYISALYGVWMAGKTAFPLSIQLTAHELAPLLSQASASTVITTGAICPELKTADIILIEELSAAETDAPPELQNRSPDDIIIMLTTSGTTGKAKIVQLTERNVETAVLGYTAYNDYPRFGEAEIRYTLGTPFSSVYGLLILPACLLRAFPIVVPEGAFTLDTFYKAIEKHKVTHYEGGTAIPILMDQMSGKEIPYDISTLRFVGFGGSKVASEVLHRLDQAYPDVEFCPGYGMTETAAMIARPYKRIKPNKRGSIGTAIPNVLVMVAVDGKITGKPDITGELVVKGPNVTPGYYQDDANTREILRNGWLYTGDIGYVDAEGDIFISGRKKNVIMVRGFSVYAEEVEEAFQSSGLVKECVVYGQSEASGNEVLCADIVPASPEIIEEQLKVWCMNHLADYKRPQRIRTTSSIAKTSTGKPARTGKESHGAN